MRPSNLAQNSCLHFHMELGLQAAQVTEAGYDCILHLASSFQFVSAHKNHLLCPTIFQRKSLREDGKGHGDNITLSELAF